MKKFFFLLITLINLCFFSSASYSNEKIVFINFEYVINNSDHGKLIFSDLKKIRDENVNELKIKEKKSKIRKFEEGKNQKYFQRKDQDIK